jgi:hypothetical protein
VLITINTTEITDADRAVLALVLEGYDGSAAQAPTTPMAAEQAEKPKRSRRTNLEIAFDTAKEAHDADPTEFAALVIAAEDLKAKDPGNERLTDFDPADYQPIPEQAEPEPTPDSENAESDAVTLEDLKTLAGELIAEHGRAALQEVVTKLGIKRLSDAPADRYAEAAELIRAKLNG